jgi:hypothetical protein
MDSMIRQGLTVLSDVLRITDHEELVQVIRQSIERGQMASYTYDDWITEVVSDNRQARRLEEWYSEEDAAQDRGDKMTFVTDTPGLPPLTWVTYWQEEASNLFGSYVPRIWRRWGYIMWDAARLEASGAMKYLELETRSDHTDAREYIREENWGELFGY